MSVGESELLAGNLDTCPELVALTTTSECSLMSESPAYAAFSPAEFMENLGSSSAEGL